MLGLKLVLVLLGYPLGINNVIIEFMTHSELITVGHSAVKLTNKTFLSSFTATPYVYASISTQVDTYTNAFSYAVNITLTGFDIAVKNWNSGYNANVQDIKVIAIGY